MKALYITFLFFLPTLFINDYNLTGSWPFVALKTIFLLGLYRLMERILHSSKKQKEHLFAPKHQTRAGRKK
jgi:hypothetical protein